MTRYVPEKMREATYNNTLLNSQGYFITEGVIDDRNAEIIKQVFETVSKENKITHSTVVNRKLTQVNRIQKFPMSNDRLKLENLLEPVYCMLERLGYSRSTIGQGPEGISLLKNDAGVPEQLPHTDYGTSIDTFDQSSKETDAHLKLPAVAIITLDDNTPFNVWPGHVNHKVGRGCGRSKLLYSYDVLHYYKQSLVIPNKGSVLVFRGDLIHAGASNDHSNARLHVSINKRAKNGQFTIRNSSACPNESKAQSIRNLRGQTNARFNQCDRTVWIKHFVEPGSENTTISEYKDLKFFQVARAWKNDEHHYRIVLTQTPNEPPYFSVKRGLFDTLAVKFTNETSEHTPLQDVSSIEHGYSVSSRFTLFGPNTIEECMLLVNGTVELVPDPLHT